MNDTYSKWLGFLRLTRPANLPTAAADIWAGAAISGGMIGLESAAFVDLGLLTLASILLYAAGVVLNDVFDASIDEIERPERPIPSGVVSRQAGFLFGITLLGSGIIAAYLQGNLAGIIAFFLAFFILIYDVWAKHLSFLGPLVMGTCRGLNLLLGLSLIGTITSWWYVLFPIAYIFAVTLVSRGEVHGKNKGALLMAGLIYALVISGVVYVNPIGDNPMTVQGIVIGLWGVILFYTLFKAYKNNTAGNIKNAVIAGVLGIIMMDAAMAAPFAPVGFTLAILALFPLSIGLSRMFKVT